jgi:putative DNA primase/helicase
MHVSNRGKWMRWEDRRWVLCEKEEEVAEAKLVCSQILTAASQVLARDQERGKRLVQEALTAHNLTKITAMLKLAISEPGMATTDGELDTDPHMLGVSNGVVDLRTGLLHRNEPRLKVTRYCGAAYVEDWTCPKWLQFLDQVFQGDVDTIETVQLLLGYTLVGSSTEEKLIICYGHGSNGKSVFSNVVQKIVGGYAVTAPPSLLTARKSGDTSPRNDLAALAGARLVSINETQAGDRLDEQIVKMLAGREPISARFLHQEFFEYTPAFTPWLRTNHKPIVIGSDDGIWRRLVLLPFRRKFSDDEKDPGLEDKLRQERDGILGWMIDGAIKYLKDGLILSPRIKAEINTYRNDSDVLGDFLDENATLGAAEKVDQSTLYQRFRSWCADSGLHITAKKTFTQRLAERGFGEAKSGARRWYLGLRLNS